MDSKELKWWFQRVKNVFHFFVSLFWVIYYGYPAKKLNVIAVTGTDGKTTTCSLIYEILKAGGIKAGLITTVGSKYINPSGKEITIDSGLHVTTPEAKILQPILKKMLGAGITDVVIEATAHGLDQHRLLGTNIKIAVFTNLSHEHLDDFVSMERYAKAKLKMFRSKEVIVLNRDDEWYEFFKTQLSGKVSKIITYSKTDMKDESIPSSLKGEYNKYNISGASSVASLLKIRDEVTRKVIENFSGVAGRREEVENNKGLKVFVDFAHTPNGVQSILKQLRLETEKKLIVIFGATGGRDKDKRPIMGKITGEFADVTIITSDDTRYESQDDIAKDIISVIEKSEEKIKNKSLIIENDRKKAIELGVNLANPGDTVVILGKGHERTINLGGVELPWSDVARAREALQKYRNV